MQICYVSVKLVVTEKRIRSQMCCNGALDAWKAVYFAIFYRFNFDVLNWRCVNENDRFPTAKNRLVNSLIITLDCQTWILFMIIRCVSQMFLICYEQVNFPQHTNAPRLFFHSGFEYRFGTVQKLRILCKLISSRGPGWQKSLSCRP